MRLDKRLPLVQQDRLVSLDALRGLTVAAMILVTDPGTYSAVFPQLLHAAWQGATATDMIFPGFLAVTGVAMTLSFASRVARGEMAGQIWVHVLRRSATVLLLGLVLNAFPDFHFATLRLPGVLQRIAVCYLLGSAIYLPLREKFSLEVAADRRRRFAVLAASIAALLLTYGLLLRLVPVPGFGAGHLDPNGNLAAYIDRSVFGIAHMWPFGTTPGVGVTFDPEGLLSTLPALATLLMGVVAGEVLRAPLSPGRRAGAVGFAGGLLVVLGLLLMRAVPLIKKIWTPSFACLSGGVALLLFAALLWLVDVRGWRRWTVPLRVFGMNAILAFVISGVLTTTLDRWHAAGRSMHTLLYERGFAAWLPAREASLLYALTVVAVNGLILLPWYRRGWFWRV